MTPFPGPSRAYRVSFRYFFSYFLSANRTIKHRKNVEILKSSSLFCVAFVLCRLATCYVNGTVCWGLHIQAFTQFLLAWSPPPITSNSDPRAWPAVAKDGTGKMGLKTGACRCVIGIPVGQTAVSTGEEPGVDAALRTEVCCLVLPPLPLVLPVRVDVRVDVLAPPRRQSHSCHWRCLHRYIFDDDRSK